MNKKSILILIVAALVIAGGLYFAMHERALAPTVPAVETASTSTTETEPGTPRIDSVVPAKARIGDTVEIQGSGFSGFEGDKYAWIENSAGEKGIIYGDMKVATDSLIRFTLEAKYCTKDTSYSGLPCPSYIEIVPGAYKIFVYPWGKASNKIDFAVVK